MRIHSYPFYDKHRTEVDIGCIMRIVCVVCSGGCLPAPRQTSQNKIIDNEYNANRLSIIHGNEKQCIQVYPV